MIRKLNNDDLDHVMKIWLEANITAHSFIPQSYWNKQFGYVRKVIPEAEIYIYENVREIIGFIGLSNNYIAGLFVAPRSQSEGIGKQLLDYIKGFRPELYLKVYRKIIAPSDFMKGRASSYNPKRSTQPLEKKNS